MVFLPAHCRQAGIPAECSRRLYNCLAVGRPQNHKPITPKYLSSYNFLKHTSRRNLINK